MSLTNREDIRHIHDKLRSGHHDLRPRPRPTPTFFRPQKHPAKGTEPTSVDAEVVDLTGEPTA
jgi:hypothetical protein